MGVLIKIIFPGNSREFPGNDKKFPGNRFLRFPGKLEPLSGTGWGHLTRPRWKHPEKIHIARQTDQTPSLLHKIIHPSMHGICFWPKQQCPFASRYEVKMRQTEDRMRALGLLTPTSLLTLDEWEIPRDRVVINRKLGEGAFGTVYGGEAFFDERGWVSFATLIVCLSLSFLGFRGGTWMTTMWLGTFCKYALCAQHLLLSLTYSGGIWYTLNCYFCNELLQWKKQGMDESFSSLMLIYLSPSLSLFSIFSWPFLKTNSTLFSLCEWLIITTHHPNKCAHADPCLAFWKPSLAHTNFSYHRCFNIRSIR